MKKHDGQFRDIGTKIQVLTLKRENIKLQKRIAKFEAENITLQNRIKVLKKKPKQSVKIVRFSKK